MKKSTLFFFIGWLPIIIVMGLIFITLTIKQPAVFFGVLSIVGVIAWFFWWCDKADELEQKGE